jgi:hypothetical protein
LPLKPRYNKMLTGSKRNRDEGDVVKGISNEDLIKLLELKKRRDELTSQLHSVEQEIVSLEQQKERAILARNNALFNAQLQGMEPFLEKLLNIDGHMAQISSYTKELKDRVSLLEEKLNVKSPLNVCNSNSCEGITKKDNKGTLGPAETGLGSSKNRLWLMTTLQKRCNELESYNKDLNQLKMIVDLANKDLTDYKNLKHILSNKR